MNSSDPFEEFHHVDPSDLAAQGEEMDKVRRRLNLIMDLAKIGRPLSPLAVPAPVDKLCQALAGQEMIEVSEVEMDDFDVRDVPELAAYAKRLGYQHGYTGKPLRFSCFAFAMLRAHGRSYPGLEPKHYESYYVGGHLRGENDVVQFAQYAINHGETRAPAAPVMTGHWRSW